MVSTVENVEPADRASDQSLEVYRNAFPDIAGSGQGPSTRSRRPAYSRNLIGQCIQTRSNSEDLGSN